MRFLLIKFNSVLLEIDVFKFDEHIPEVVKIFIRSYKFQIERTSRSRDLKVVLPHVSRAKIRRQCFVPPL